MRKIEENKNIIEIKEETQIGDVVLEKGDKIEVLTERKIPLPWVSEEELFNDVYMALEEARVEVRSAYSTYEDSETIQIIKDGQRYELDLYLID